MNISYDLFCRNYPPPSQAFQMEYADGFFGNLWSTVEECVGAAETSTRTPVCVHVWRRQIHNVIEPMVEKL